jgi:radical SAM protein with 4Fe4S-binding SPASM domain
MELKPPVKCILEVTMKCNMRCLHCASSAATGRPAEMGTEKMLSIIDECRDIGVKEITFSGGEPLLRKDWPELAARIKEYGMRSGIVSNGTFVKDQIDNIARYFETFSMSLDGLEDVHNHIRQSKNAFRDVMEAFKDLEKHDVHSCAITSLSKFNFHQLEDLYRLVIEHEIPSWQVQLTFASGRMKDQSEQLLSPRDLHYLIQFLVDIKKDKIIDLHVSDNIGYYTAAEDTIRGRRWNGCKAGITVFSIEADGTVKGCLCQIPEYIEGKGFVEGNINQTSLKEIWYDKNSFSYNRNFEYSKVEGFCASCRYLERCKCGCSAFAYYVTGKRYSNPYCIYRLMATE